MIPPSRWLTCFPGRLDAEVLVVTADLLVAGVEHDEVVDEFEQALRGAEVTEFAKQGRRGGVGVGITGLLPAQPVRLRGLDHAVAQPLGLVAREDELHGGEERLDELLLLVVQILADTLGHRDGRALELEHADRDPVHVEHDVGPLGVLPFDRDLFGDGEVVGGRILPVDQPDGNHVFAHPRTDHDAVAEETVDFAVGFVERLASAESGVLAELV